MNKNLTEAIAKLKVLLFADALPEEAKPEDKPADKLEIKSKDGKVYKASALEVGATIEVTDETGVLSPAPDGEIELEDGSKITTKEGKIETVTPAEAKKDAANPADADPAQKFDTPVDPNTATVSKVDFDLLQVQVNGLFSAVYTDFEKRITSLEEGIAKILGQGASSAAAMSAMFEVIEAISNESSATPSGAPKSNAFRSATNEKEEARIKLKEAFQSVKK